MLITFLPEAIEPSGNLGSQTGVRLERAWEASSKAVGKIRFSSGAANESAMKSNAPWDCFHHALRANCEARGRQFIKRSASVREDHALRRAESSRPWRTATLPHRPGRIGKREPVPGR